MNQAVSLNKLWESAIPQERIFSADLIQNLPPVAQRYLKYAIAPGTKLACAVRLRMHGTIKLKDWSPFQAEQVICWNRGTIWSATAWMKGLPIFGSDRVVDGVGAMRWKLLGLFPVMTATGDDITRSATGRMLGESIWLPSILCDPTVTWTAPDESHAHATLTLFGETTELILTVNDVGKLECLRFQRWGSPSKKSPSYADFGGYMEQEGTFSGYTIPTQFRVGWYFGSDRFESEGEFFRATIDDAIYR